MITEKKIVANKVNNCYIGINPNTSKPKGIAFNA